MRILHLDPDDIESPASGGGPIRTFEIYKRLAKRHDITVLTPTFPGSKATEIKEGIRYVRLGRKWGNHNSTYYISYYLVAPFEARKYECDLLVEDLMPPTAATITPLLNARKIVASVQWFFAKEWAEQYRIPFHWYQPFGLKLYQNYIVLNENMKNKLLGFNPRAEVRVIPNGLNPGHFQPPRQADNFMLYLGRVENQQKGVDFLVEAFSKISKKTGADLVIAGDGVDLEKTKSEVNRLELSGRVKFEGKVGMERKLDLLSRCQFVCVPSRYETFCMVALEAFACRKPVVAFDIPFLDVVTKDVAVKVKAFDVQTFADAMLHLLNNPDQAKQMGARAHEHAMDFTWDRMAELQENFYESILNDNHR